MKLTKMRLEGAYIIDIEKIEDNRGFFARMWDKDVFTELNLDSDIIQGNISYNKGGNSHFGVRKNSKRKRRLRKSVVMSKAMTKRTKLMV